MVGEPPQGSKRGRGVAGEPLQGKGEAEKPLQGRGGAEKWWWYSGSSNQEPQCHSVALGSAQDS